MGPIVTYDTKINGKHPLAKYGEFYGNRDGCFLIQSDAGVHARRDNSLHAIFRLCVSNQKDKQ
ncbi:hypothetical protein C8K18_12740 [Paraburkholderia sp. GV068]|uniref:hypothetical protein n=1 Tax=unclassified Paraburkholderia TaxID=2615204 RepID=UPI000D2F4B49|nr:MULTISPECIES: hypothetical protein [unclassified Paraburkholderia]PTQ91665.1 hypothetical protein C8K19_12740 [Paraburkholderia sp. GV072]PUA93903.1 hypothetical protein C8K18_12740 [Paraburkholderia sp. GV068]